MMKCSICSHKRRKEIEASIAANESNRRTATQYGTSEAAIRRHAKNCIKPILQEVVQEQRAATAITVMGDLDWARNQQQALYSLALAADDMRTANQVLTGFLQQTKLRAELTGELKKQSVLMMPEFQETLALLFDALKAYPDAHQAVITQLEAERVKRRAA